MITDNELKTIDNSVVFDSFIKARSVLAKHKKIAVSISGGADSDIVLDLIEKAKTDENEVHYVWFDTGIEYQATKDHLIYLENRYGITIERVRAKKTIPVSCKEFGQPFVSKYVSENIERMQKNGFKFEEKPQELLDKEYPTLRSAIAWWCDTRCRTKRDGMTSMFNIERNKWLKEFLVSNPPTFRISNKCCTYAKKKVSRDFNKASECDLNVIGVRRAEGGVRSALNNCYTDKNSHGVATYRPIFWYGEEDKRWYEKHFSIVHSECYTKYGLKRTGCVGCPFNSKFLQEQQQVETYEPGLIKACNVIFKDSYEYTKKYREFQARMNAKEKALKGQTDIYDFIKE